MENFIKQLKEAIQNKDWEGGLAAAAAMYLHLRLFFKQTPVRAVAVVPAHRDLDESELVTKLEECVQGGEPVDSVEMESSPGALKTAPKAFSPEARAILMLLLQKLLEKLV